MQLSEWDDITILVDACIILQGASLRSGTTGEEDHDAKYDER
jgi:hypothetical protein